MREVGIVATEFGPDGFLPDEPVEKADALAAAHLRAVGQFVPVVLHDEYESSVEATAELGLGGRPLSERERGLVDARAAAITLRRYLDRLEPSRPA